MRFSTTASLFALFTAFVHADDTPSDVLSLTAADFESVVNAEPLILVEFYAPWFVLLSFAVPFYQFLLSE